MFALESVLRFRKHWERFEEDMLIADRDALYEEREEDAEKFHEEKITELNER
jgi:hypothetical protein